MPAIWPPINFEGRLRCVMARAPNAAELFDRLQLRLIVSALVADAVTLAAGASRFPTFDFAPNSVAALRQTCSSGAPRDPERRCLVLGTGRRFSSGLRL